MAYATCDQYGEVKLGVDAAGMIKISVDGASIHMSPQEAARIQGELPLVIAEAAQKAAQKVTA